MKISNYTQAIEKTISKQPSLIPNEVLCEYVSNYQNIGKNFLKSIENLNEPLYILDSKSLKNKARIFQNSFKKHITDAAFFFAMKSNNHPVISKILTEENFGLDVSSGKELESALETENRQIIFSGPGKTEKELSLAVKNSDKVTLLVDSFGELNKLSLITSEMQKTINIGVRITPPNTSWSKFGININQLEEFINQTKKTNHIEFCGIQFHTSWNMNSSVQEKTIKALGKAIEKLPATYQQLIKFIDIGGGFWPEEGEWLQPAATPIGILNNALEMEVPTIKGCYYIPASPIQDFAKNIASTITKHIFNSISCRICFEPGRWICNNSMHMIMTVIDKKDDNTVITDAGTNSIGWDRFETDYAPIINLTRPNLTENKCYIYGSLCTPHDIWGYTYWGSGIENGDILMIPNQGAYTYSLRQNFIKPIPEVFIIE